MERIVPSTVPLVSCPLDVTGRSEPDTPAATKLALAATLLVTAAGLAEFLRRAPAAAIDPRLAGYFLWLFSALFLVRVAGQLAVRAWRPRWLPPAQQWNLTPYRLLLPAQLAILGVMTWVGYAFWSRDGAPVTPAPDVGAGVLAFAGVYAAAMAVRYVVRMSRRPDQRWLGGTIPIVFHWVLASYLVVFGEYHLSY